jgi:NAD-reducing hydrogenase small subunit
MSFLDLDQRLIDLAGKVELVYSPLVDAKKMPPTVDVGLLEGAVSTEEDLAKVKMFRKHCKYLISLGDCAVGGNVPSMRNLYDLEDVFDHAYKETVDCNPQRPTDGVPKLLHPVRPVHAVVKVDCFVQGCPPSADTIWRVLCELIEGGTPKPVELTRFGA